MTATPPEPRTAHISAAQMRVLRELCKDGADNRAIANQLNMSESTVLSHITRIRTALGVHNRAAVVAAVLNRRVLVEVTDRRVTATPIPRGVAHLGPPPGALLLATECCHRLVQELPPRHRVTRSPDRVTCGGAQ